MTKRKNHYLFFMPLFFTALCAALLYGCGQKAGGDDVVESDKASLDALAINAGLITDPDNIIFEGRFEERSELGIDKFCAIKTSGDEYNIGILAVFGPESKCEGSGTARLDGEKLSISLNSKQPCVIEAKFDGTELRINGIVPASCQSYCSDRASLSGTLYYFVEHGKDAAQSVKGRDIDRLCS
ncbi:hypothetical protein [Sphingorhabdus lutea]|nr:hypothetical protein [Sphingorhabdus lutea]